MKRAVVFAVAVLYLVLCVTPAQAVTSLGTITAQGYFPPSGVTVIWHIAGQADVTKRLNPAFLFTSRDDVTGFLCRYAECDRSVVGRQIVPFVTSEHGGGEGFAILQELFRQSGLTRDPSLQESYDWMIANGDGRPFFTCADFIGYTGHARPGCQDIVPGGVPGDESGLRPQPNDPPDCCEVLNPCIVWNEAGRRNGEEWTEAVRTPQGGRKGCRLRNLIEGQPEEPPGPEEPPTPPVDAAACTAFTQPIQAALTTCQGEKTTLTKRIQDLQTEITTLKARVAELEGRRFDTLDTTRFTAALQGLNRPGKVTIRPRTAQEIQATTDFLRSLQRRQCLAVP